MKTIVFLLAMIAGSFAYAQNATTSELTVSVNNVRNNDGSVLFALYSEENFMKKPLFSLKSEIKDGMASANFKELPKGTYAVIVMHDENGNQRMDFQPSGMPDEDYGTSNNAVTYGPPSWNDSKFEFSAAKPEHMEIRF